MAIASFFFLFIAYPVPKQAKKIPLSQAIGLLRDPFLMLFALLLALQSGLEGLLNNWSNSYILEKGLGSSAEALYALSVSMIALTLSRLMMSKLLNLYSSRMILWFSLMIMGLGIFLFHTAGDIKLVMFSLALMGLGIGPVFPIALGFVGEKFADLSATAFSLVFGIALGGNMIINYFMGWLATQQTMTALPYLEASVILTMLFLFYLIDYRIFRK
jgi:fucose permease